MNNTGYMLVVENLVDETKVNQKSEKKISSNKLINSRIHQLQNKKQSS